MDKDFLRQIDDVEALLPSKDADKLDDDVLICECFCVSVQDIRQTFEATRVVDLEILQKQFSMGQGCQSCINRIGSWIDKIF